MIVKRAEAPLKLSEMSKEQLIAKVQQLEKREAILYQRLDKLIVIGKGFRNLSKKDKKLTLLGNTKALEEQLVREVARSLREESPLTVMMLDLDGMKKVNDTLGHEAGDKMLFAVQEVIVERLRKEDFAAREGGDEFYVLMPNTDMKGAQNVGSDIKRQLGNYLKNHRSNEDELVKNAKSDEEKKKYGEEREEWDALRQLLPNGIGISIGIAIMDEYAHNIVNVEKIIDIGKELRGTADQNMYSDKKSKNAQRK